MSLNRSGRAAALAAMLIASAAMAQPAPEQPQKQKPPRAYLMSPVLRSRTAAPMPIEVRIEYEGEKVLRGPLEIAVIDRGQTLTRVTTPEIVVTKGTYAQRYTLPAVLRSPDSDDPAMATIRMRTADGLIDLGLHPLGAPDRSERSMVLGIVEAQERAGGRSSSLVTSVMLDRFKPDRREQGIAVMPARVNPIDLPTDPTELCAFDTVLTPPDGFAELDEKQLAALGQWLHAGGSVCVVTGGQLAARHAAFLNGAIGGAAGSGADGDVRFALNADGRVEVHGGSLPDGFGVWRCGLGRLVVAVNPEGERYFDSPTWAAAVAKLWKMRRDQIIRVASGIGWDRNAERTSPWRHATGDFEISPTPGRLHYGPLPTPGGSMIPSLLMPTSVQVVPFSVVVGILVLFALAIGPGDWLLLGLIKQRKLTWLLFPATALAFTLLTVVVADRTMGSGDHERAIVVVDVGDSGTVLRRTRIELQFPGRHKTLVYELERQMATRMDRSAYEPPTMSGQSTAVDKDDLIAVIDGRMPTRWRLTQRIRKWTPWMNRFTEIAPADAQPPVHVPWGKLVGVVRSATPAAVANVETNAETAADAAVDAAIKRVMADRPFSGAVVLYGPAGPARVAVGSLNPRELGFDSNVGDMRTLLDDLCARPREGLFTFVSQVSPTGSDNLEDLSLLDASDPSQRLLVVIEAKGDDLMVYRHLFNLEGAAR